MSKRSIFYYWLFTATVFLSGIFWGIWRYVPRVRTFRYWGLRGSFIRATETVCAIDPALHDCNMTLEGSCPADSMRSRILGVQGYVGPIGFYWPRDARSDWGT